MAGKTTSLGIMTGEVIASGGDAYISGHSVTSNPFDAFQQLGFCPQFSALWENITVMEHAYGFARFKGYTKAQAQAVARTYLDKLAIEQYADVRSHKLVCHDFDIEMFLIYRSLAVLSESLAWPLRCWADPVYCCWMSLPLDLTQLVGGRSTVDSHSLDTAKILVGRYLRSSLHIISYSYCKAILSQVCAHTA